MKNLDLATIDERYTDDETVGYIDEHQRLRVLLNVTSEISKEIQLERLLFIIMDEVKKAVSADRCSVFLLDEEKNELWSKVAHGGQDIRFPSNTGIAGYVAKTGELLNIKDAYADSRFNQEIDQKTGYRTRNMLTFPMKNKRNEIIGVFQVLNKLAGNFNSQDEELVTAISCIAASQIENAQLYEQQRKAFNSFIETLASTIDARDQLTAGHSKRIELYSSEMAQIIHLPATRREVLRYASLLHDYGKISLSDAILKNNRGLTEEEYSQMRSHPAITRSILEKIFLPKNLKDLPRIAGAHHEKYDGSGYPEGLKFEEIPFEARILTVADAFDAMTSNRRYSDRIIDFEKVIRTLENDSGTHFDPNLVAVFKKIRLDRLVTILEFDSRELIQPDDLKELAQFTITDLLDELRKGNLLRRKTKVKITKIFNKYYHRKHLK